MENLIQKIEAELLKLKNDNLLSIGKKVIPEVAKRLSVAAYLESETDQGALKERPPVEIPESIHLSILEQMKEKFGGIPTWKIPADEYLEIVEQCKKEAANGRA
ncbi:MAG: hypothetical protein PHN44_01370 [Candidatus Marinimicrobia bacterium]|nr:hypothetical protein [Candidatus Neomarinimicrobiota bacterium]